MIINLFSIFDPCTSLSFSINWFRRLFVILFFPLIYWFIPSRYRIIYLIILIILINEFKALLFKKINLNNIIILIRLFIIILLNNFLGIFLYIFTSSAHLVISLTLRIILWVSFILFGWIKNINYIFTHLVPQGTPIILIPFIVVIETLRNLIRAGTLRVRLTANIIAGHLLITLISSTGPSLNLNLLVLILLVQSILIILELRVSVIQSYVFSVLRTLYRRETN